MSETLATSATDDTRQDSLRPRGKAGTAHRPHSGASTRSRVCTKGQIGKQQRPRDTTGRGPAQHCNLAKCTSRYEKLPSGNFNSHRRGMSPRFVEGWIQARAAGESTSGSTTKPSFT